jgi:hypothetical protein
MTEQSSDQGDAMGNGRTDARAEQVLEQIRQALTGLRFGQISVIVQDGVVVQIERIERRRLSRESS